MSLSTVPLLPVESPAWQPVHTHIDSAMVVVKGQQPEAKDLPFVTLIVMQNNNRHLQALT